MAVWRRGILIPGTYFGKIQGFQIRLDHKMKKGGKFLTFSSRDELDGAMGENWCHMVGPVRERILLIEGYMKADIVNHFTGQTMLAIPGVTSLQHLESALRDLIPMGVRHIMTCFDMDYLKTGMWKVPIRTLLNCWPSRMSHLEPICGFRITTDWMITSGSFA